MRRVVPLGPFRCLPQEFFYDLDGVKLGQNPFASICSVIRQMSLTVSKCRNNSVAKAPADKVKKYPSLVTRLYFVVGRGGAYWSYQRSAVARRGRRKVSAAIRSSAREGCA